MSVRCPWCREEIDLSDLTGNRTLAVWAAHDPQTCFMAWIKLAVADPESTRFPEGHELSEPRRPSEPDAREGFWEVGCSCGYTTSPKSTPESARKTAQMHKQDSAPSGDLPPAGGSAGA